MTSTPLPFKPTLLAATDAGNRTLGLSPSKPVTDSSRTSLGRPLQSGDDEPITQSDHVGLNAVDGKEGYGYTITSRRSIALLLGRASNENEEVGNASAPISTEHHTLGTTPIQRIALPSSAKHVSRDHAVIFHSPFGSSWAIKILGQNGLIVNGKRKKAGLVLRLEAGHSTLDFFGVKCLFLGGTSASERKVQGGQEQHSLQNGQSPTKRALPPSSRPSLGTSTPLDVAPQKAAPLQERTVSPIKQLRLVGNPLKRPFGAPLSPPTSSPAPFDHSSPVKGHPRRHVLASSSPVRSDDEEGESSSDEEYQDPRGSPSLSRRSAKHDDSGVVLQAKKRRGSEDEASQALKQDALQAEVNKIGNGEPSDSGAEESDRSPSPTPAKRRQEKRVKFTHRDSPKTEARERVPSLGSSGRVGATPGPLPLSFEKIQSHLRSRVAQLAETYDLQGLLAGAIVFHRTATISATEAVRSVLTSNPGLLRGECGPEGTPPPGAQKGCPLSGWSFDDIVQSDLVSDSQDLDKERVELWQKRAWRERLEESLMEGECFGIISRAGKDASGNPLECWYYYDKERDPDMERAANLGALAKPMRAALKTHKPIFWKKSAYGHSNDAAGKNDGGALASESQWGSSGSTLDSLLFSRSNSLKGEEEKAAGLALGSWEETQYEEREQTWDRQGDTDFEMGGRRIKRRR